MHAFDYVRPSDVAEAVAALSANPEAKVLAGGQSLLPMIKQQLARPEVLVDLSRVEGLRGIDVTAETVSIGAMVRHCEVAASKEVAVTIPALCRLAAGIGDVQVRHRGTIGGSVSNNDPAADYPAACVGLGATIVTSSRRLAAEEFFVDMFETALEPDEIVTRVEFPRPVNATYRKFRHPISRYALVGVFLARTRSEVRLAVTGASPAVFRLGTFERALSDRWEAASLASCPIDASSLMADIHASAEYRAHMIRHMTVEALSELTMGPQQ